jgi:hypothetical protein
MKIDNHILQSFLAIFTMDLKESRNNGHPPDNMSETGLHVLHRQLAIQQQTIKQMKGKA